MVDVAEAVARTRCPRCSLELFLDQFRTFARSVLARRVAALRADGPTLTAGSCVDEGDRRRCDATLTLGDVLGADGWIEARETPVVAGRYDVMNDLMSAGLHRAWKAFTVRQAALRPGMKVLDIGSGWGGMAIYAAKHTGCRATTTTISQEQYDLAKARVEAEGLQDRITLLFEDYRDLDGQFDKLVSIEMIEAIGHQFQDTYFAKCASLLKPGGKALIQAITIEDHRYQQALDSVDFIKRYIFPGSYIPCVSAMVSSAAQAGKLRLLDLQDIGDSYAKTIHAWRERFLSRESDVLALGYDRRFLRMWDFYLAYCEAGFLEQSISDVHLLLGKERYPA
jgi:cyclopropane fatty-acyl-phospholipid synthase-like methyltransferase